MSLVSLSQYYLS